MKRCAMVSLLTSSSNENGLAGAKIIGALFVLTGLILLLIGSMHVFGIPELKELPGMEKLAEYLGSVGALMEFVYGILAVALGIGLIKEEEWAAGGSFVLLVIIIPELGSYFWYMYSLGGVLPTTAWLALAVVVLSIIILVYLIWAKGWK